jgi:dihydroorotate dehydrogenase (NAD+) catalytic subunit
MIVEVGGLSMRNPVTTASGTFASGREYANFAAAAMPGSAGLGALGALTTKGVSYEAWPGNGGVRIAEASGGMLNSIGLENKGVEAFCNDDLLWLSAQDVPVIVNVCSHAVEGFAPVIERLEQTGAVSAYEINVSCPNVDGGGMSFGIDPQLAAQVTRRCREATARPLIVKLTPNVTDITTVAQAVEAAGADALSMINTVAGMAIDLRSRKSVFARGMGGLSGPAIKPIALLAVHRCHQKVSIPIIGMGGISCAADAIEFMLAGASAIAVGTASFIRPATAMTLADEMRQWCLENDVTDIRDIVGGLET